MQRCLWEKKSIVFCTHKLFDDFDTSFSLAHDSTVLLILWLRLHLCLGTRLYLRYSIYDKSLDTFSSVSFQLKRPLSPIGYTTANHNSVATVPAAAHKHTQAPNPQPSYLNSGFWLVERSSAELGTPINEFKTGEGLTSFRMQQQVLRAVPSCGSRWESSCAWLHVTHVFIVCVFVRDNS